jgi:phage terminase Nu1 subunit (DNA packaging protein)
MSKITYNQIETLTGKPYRTIKKHLDTINVQPIERTGNKVFFESVDVLELKNTEPEKGNEDWTKLLEEERYRKLKRENDLADDLVAPLSKLTEALEKTMAQVVPILEALPMEMKRLNPKLTGHDIQAAKKAIATCRNAMADAQIEFDEEEIA